MKTNKPKLKTLKKKKKKEKSKTQLSAKSNAYNECCT